MELLSQSKRKPLIYVARNPKDVLVSYYHYSKFSTRLEEIDFDFFMERFLNGKLLPGSWLDHVEGWYAHRDDFNILFLTYEEMKKDLRGSVLKICNFLGKRLTEKVLFQVVDKATFDKMRQDHRSNYENLPDDVDMIEGIVMLYYAHLKHVSQGRFLCKGTVGDWKNTMTVAQSERFDSVFKESMEKLPFKFCWDISDEL
ncbi:amine sulfotransferase-like [Tiliqua scincoides]|uniref:amine sulfotransferase-like n=1 Tax=Tiliqua scincoides TaxID=71010 RepID=UPI00346382D2